MLSIHLLGPNSHLKRLLLRLSLCDRCSSLARGWLAQSLRHTICSVATQFFWRPLCNSLHSGLGGGRNYSRPRTKLVELRGGYQIPFRREVILPRLVRKESKIPGKRCRVQRCSWAGPLEPVRTARECPAVRNRGRDRGRWSSADRRNTAPGCDLLLRF